MKLPSRGEDEEAGREKKREASTGVLGMCKVNFCSLNIYMLFSGSVNQSFYKISISSRHLSMDDIY